MVHPHQDMGRSGGSVVKSPPANARDSGWIPELGRPPWGGNGTPFQYSCLENAMDRWLGRLEYMGSQKSQTRLRDETTNKTLGYKQVALSNSAVSAETTRGTPIRQWKADTPPPLWECQRRMSSQGCQLYPGPRPSLQQCQWRPSICGGLSPPLTVMRTPPQTSRMQRGTSLSMGAWN